MTDTALAAASAEIIDMSQRTEAVIAALAARIARMEARNG